MAEILPVGIQENDLLTLAAGVESVSQHPLASAIVEAAKARKLPTADAPEKFENLPGQGLRAETCGGTVLAGNRRLMEESGVDLTALEQDEVQAGRAGTHAHVLCKGRKAAGADLRGGPGEDHPARTPLPR